MELKDNKDRKKEVMDARKLQRSKYDKLEKTCSQRAREWFKRKPYSY